MAITLPTNPAGGDTAIMGSTTFTYDSDDDKWVGTVASGGSSVTSASTAETLAGALDNKYVSPVDLKAALQNGANYTISTSRAASGAVDEFAKVTISNVTPATTAARAITGILTGGTDTASVWSAGTTGAVSSGVTINGTNPLYTARGVAGLNEASGTGVKVSTSGYSGGTGGTNIGVYGIAVSGTTNWAGYFDGNVKVTDNLLIGAASNLGASNGVDLYGTAGAIGVSSVGTNVPVSLYTPAGLTTGHISFVVGGTQVGGVVCSPVGTTYQTVSDYRLKTAYQPLTGSGAFIDSLKPYRGEWKAEPGKSATYFLAHEVAEVSPTSVQGEKDAVEDIGTLTSINSITRENVPEPSELKEGQTWTKTSERPVMQSMEYGSADFITNIIAELQDLRKRSVLMEQQIAELIAAQS